MTEILTIPKKLIQKGELVIIPRAEYEAALRVKKRLLWEEKDTDEAIRIFEREKRGGTLKKASRFTTIFDMRRTA